MRPLTGSLLLLLLVGCSNAPIGEYRSRNDTPVDSKDESEEGEATSPAADAGASGPGGTATLTVNLLGSGAGTIMSTPSGLTCQNKICTGTFPAGATVGLVPNPAAGSTFSGWGGACTGNGACTPKLDGNVTVTATLDGALAGTFAGQYTHGATSGACTFTNQGNLTVTFANGSTTANITGVQLRQSSNCAIVTNTATGAAPAAPVTVNGTATTGTWAFAVTFNGSGVGTLALPFNATMNGTQMTGTWTCPTCTGSFTLTKQP